MSKENGGPAFPVTLPSGESYQGQLRHDGMTLRDYFAAKAMQAMLTRDCPICTSSMANDAYIYADSMLAARVKP